MKQSVYEIEFKDAKGETTSLNPYRGKIVLIVNVASKCGFTPQYTGLEALYKKFQDRGLVILGFPCNQFGGQEPGTAEEIQSFCQLNYGVSFPILSKVDVNGSDQAPLFSFLKSRAPGILGSEAVKWNFTKFIVNKNGEVISRFAPTTKPEDLESEIESLL